MTSLGEFARQQARRFSDRLFFVAGEAAVTYRQYDEQTDRPAGGGAR